MLLNRQRSSVEHKNPPKNLSSSRLNHEPHRKARAIKIAKIILYIPILSEAVWMAI